MAAILNVIVFEKCFNNCFTSIWLNSHENMRFATLCWFVTKISIQKHQFLQLLEIFVKIWRTFWIKHICGLGFGFTQKNLTYFDSQQNFASEKVLTNKIYSNYDLTIGITKRSFNTKNVKEKLFPFHEKSGFASKSINRWFIN